MTTYSTTKSNIKNANLAVHVNPPFHERNVAYVDPVHAGDLAGLKASGEILNIAPVHMLKVTFAAGSPTLASAKAVGKGGQAGF